MAALGSGAEQGSGGWGTTAVSPLWSRAGGVPSSAVSPRLFPEVELLSLPLCPERAQAGVDGQVGHERRGKKRLGGG